MLATFRDKPFSDPNWVFECKLDGVRCLAFRSGGQVRLLSRNQKSLNAAFPELVEALERQPRDRFIVDGEIVAFAPAEGAKGSEVTSFGRLQGRLGVSDPRRAALLARTTPVYFYLFDILHVDGHDVTRLPLVERKQLLQKVIAFSRSRGSSIRYSDHLEQQGEAMLDEACKLGWEGLIAKRADSPYTSARSRDWLKLKCASEQEFVILGYTDPQGGRVGFGALLVGYHDENGALRYAGKVGTGFDDRLLVELHGRLKKMEIARSPLASREKIPGLRGVHWVTPKLVAQVGFGEWTRDGRLRHPRFKGLRRDKPPREVVREVPPA